MSTVLRVQCTLPSVNAIPRDAAVNTFHFSSTAVDPLTDASLAFTLLEDFYESVEGIMSVWLTGDVNYKVYDLSDPEPRAPIATDSSTFTPQSGTSLPSECAICLSYGAPVFSGNPVGRFRGRIYLGPLDADVVDNGATGIVIDSGIMTAVTGAGGTLIVDSAATTTCRWTVFSPTSAGSPPWSSGDVLGASRIVDRCHVDDAFDTVRSRGISPSTRISYP